MKEGTSLEVYINDSEMGAFSSSSIGEVNAIGLYVQDDLHIHFDNVKAEPLEDFKLRATEKENELKESAVKSREEFCLGEKGKTLSSRR